MSQSPPTFDWENATAENFKLFQQSLQLYFEVKEIKKELQVPTLLLSVGNEGLRRFNSWTLTEQQKKDIGYIYNLFLEQLEPAKNYRLSRLLLSRYSQKEDETIDEFVNRCKLKAKECDFEANECDERIIELLIASSSIQEFQKELLNKPKGFTLNEAIKLGRTHEATMKHLQDIQKLSTVPVSIVQQSHQQKASGKGCWNCGKSHKIGKQYCPARNDTCKSCGKIGHWAKKCIKSKVSQKQFAGRQQKGKYQKKFHIVQNSNTAEASDEDCSDEADEAIGLQFDTVKNSKERLEDDREEAFVTLDIQLPKKPQEQKHQLKLKVDTGAVANALPIKTFRKMFPEQLDDKQNPKKQYLRPTKRRLIAYNNTPIECYGKTTIKCKFGNSKWQDTAFYVVNVTGSGILGLSSCTKLKVVTLHCAISQNKNSVVNNVGDLLKLYPNQFDRIGEFPNVHKLIVDPNVPGRINAARKTPLALKPKIKQELDDMVKQKVIRKISEPTDWVSSLTYVTKKDGSLRVCLDPRHLNRALRRPHHQIPTVEELNHNFAGMKVFSKLDAKSGYWSVKLDEESQKLTTFQTSFGKYCFMRLPFGLSVSQDIFQLEVDRILEKCPGAYGIADDIVICGETEKQHDKNLLHFMKVAAENGLTLNSKKCHIKQNEICFFGNIYTKEGIKPDPTKVNDIQKMPEPKNVTELQQFLGCVTYLSRFIPNFSDKTAILRELLKKESEFIWETHHKEAFENLKQELSSKSLLHYYDTRRPVILHCDASGKGVGAALLQPAPDNTLLPVAYASKSLTPTEQMYACIERELLAILFATRRFHTYLYGREFTVYTDHRPLEMILKKPITSAPPRLQCMLLDLCGYDITVKYFLIHIINKEIIAALLPHRFPPKLV